MDKNNMESMFPVLTNALLDVAELERSELGMTNPSAVAGRFERTEVWVDGMS